MTSRPAHIATPSRRLRISRAATTQGTRDPTSASREWATRLSDVLAGCILLLACMPLLILIALLVAGTSRGGPIFRQVRLGRDKQPFVMYKFRTMYAGCDDRLHREYMRRVLLGSPPLVRAYGLCKLVDDPRVTRVGRALRRCSIDELPQLLNVIRGDMALVGPRPVLPWEAALFRPEHCARFDVRPGITGLWQVSGRSRLSMPEALDLDLEYVKTRCLWLDVKILLRTVPIVLSCRGAR
jgi:lipopolysaccharide/colanic/teichoic acid biosynthesis glycosyltransferase